MRYFLTATTMTGLLRVGMQETPTLAMAVSQFYKEQLADDPSQLANLLIHEVLPQAREHTKVFFVTQNRKKEEVSFSVDLSVLLAPKIDPLQLHKLLGVVRYILPLRVRAHCLQDRCGAITVRTGTIACPECETIMVSPPEKPDGMWWCPDPFCDRVVRRGESVWAKATHLVSVCGQVLICPPKDGQAYCASHQTFHTVQFRELGREAISGGLARARVG